MSLDGLVPNLESDDMNIIESSRISYTKEDWNEKHDLFDYEEIVCSFL
jgi:hypothetical protein